MTRWLFVLWLAATGIAPAGIVEGGSGLLYGRGYSYWLTAPPGWMLDNESGVDQGSNAVFYPKGETWKDAPAVFYTTPRR